MALKPWFLAYFGNSLCFLFGWFGYFLTEFMHTCALLFCSNLCDSRLFNGAKLLLLSSNTHPPYRWFLLFNRNAIYRAINFQEMRIRLSYTALISTTESLELTLSSSSSIWTVENDWIVNYNSLNGVHAPCTTYMPLHHRYPIIIISTVIWF